MIDPKDIHPVTDFTRKTQTYVKRLQKTGKSEVLIVNGDAAVVVQSAGACQKLLDAVELAATLPLIQKSLNEAKRVEGRSARDVLREIAATVGLDLDK
jgi:predicted DsbA family dithiol-disulfide isomerase